METLCGVTLLTVSTPPPPSQAVKNAVGALCSLSPDQLLPRFMSHVAEGLSRPALLQVTKEEYAIMLTPAGELYDDSIMQR